MRSMDSRLQKVQQSLGRIENVQLAMLNPRSLCEYECQVYSQWGEDGLIQYLIRQVVIEHPIFVEFGVENYTESNTRFLLMNNHWSGLVIDGADRNIEFIKRDPIYWRHNLKAECAFVTAENINELLKASGVDGDIGLLSIDIDGNDYWVWDAVKVVSPRIVIVEYNARFGPHRAVTVPYDPAFNRAEAHYSRIYYGASLAALVSLGSRKGYDFVGCNSAGNNAFWVRRDVRPSALPIMTASEGFVPSQFRESRRRDGTLAFLSMDEEQRILNDLPLVDIP
ncbi:MAG: hypothetical protein HC938_17430 [Nitrospira sp.]|nr:hypothetical protein [Nitrospira sp.]